MLESLLLRGRRSLALVSGVFVALVVLISSSWRSGSSTSPVRVSQPLSSEDNANCSLQRRIVTAGWRSAHDRVSAVTQVDGLQNFVKGPGCDFSSFDLHHPFAPRCTNRHSLLDAMSGGGRLGWDEPYWARDCDMQWFTSDEVCDILSRFDHIYLIGDSMVRHLAQGLHVLMRADLVNGGRATWREGEQDDPLNCHCHTVFDNPGCVWWSAINTAELVHGDPDSIYCKKRPALVSWEAILNYPLKEEMLHGVFSTVESKKQPNGRDVFIMGHGLWNDLEAETTMSWVEQIESAMEAEMPAYFDPRLDPALFPRLFVTPSAQGEGKPDIFHGAQNNIRLMRHTHDISAFVKDRGYDHLGLYNMSVQSSSPDGTHATLQNNLMKAMMALNWMNMLDPVPRSKPPKLPDLPKSPKWKIKHRPMQPLMEAEPADPKAAVSAQSAAAKAKGTATEDTTAQPTPSKAYDATAPHPIDHLLKLADEHHGGFMRKQTTGVGQAAAAYREARGRHPPPRFDQWVKWCEERDVVMVEEFFDQLHKDLAPFWSIDPQVMRDFPKSWMNVLSIRNGTMSRWEDEPENIANWMEFWYNGLSGLPLADLPDIDLAFNGEDEPKLFVPWETVHKAMSKAEFDRHSKGPRRSTLNEYSKYEPLPKKRPPFLERNGYKWADYPENVPLWLAGRETCEPDSAARKSSADEDLTRPPRFPDPANSTYMYEGFVANWSSAKSTCENPELRSLHGTWIGMLSSSSDNLRPRQKAIITDLVPLLSGCKIHGVNSEILIPPAMQWPSAADETDFTFNFKEDARVPWDDKENLVMWRGSASGGVNDQENWTHFQRHRFLAMLNGTLVAQHERVADKPLPAHVPGGKPPLPHNFPLPDAYTYPLSVTQAADPAAALQTWIDSASDAGFIHLRCYPPPSWFDGDGADCPYNGHFFATRPIVPSAQQFRYKYQPDLDGASYSGRYRALLASNSLPIKATIYDEWHDARLLPWRHFVPMSNAFVDWWGLLEFFLGYDPAAVERAAPLDPGRVRPPRDDVARRIALQGAAWSRAVLRTDDMLAYMYRLVLELARLSDDRRDEMGFAEDVSPTKGAAGAPAAGGLLGAGRGAGAAAGVGVGDGATTAAGLGAGHGAGAAAGSGAGDDTHAAAGLGAGDGTGLGAGDGTNAATGLGAGDSTNAGVELSRQGLQDQNETS